MTKIPWSSLARMCCSIVGYRMSYTYVYALWLINLSLCQMVYKIFSLLSVSSRLERGLDDNHNWHSGCGAAKRCHLLNLMPTSAESSELQERVPGDEPSHWQSDQFKYWGTDLGSEVTWRKPESSDNGRA